MTMRAMGEVKSVMATRRRIPEPALTATPKPGPRVLVVEDEQDVADLIRYNLAKEGYDVRLVGNGADALKLARESRPEVILLDIMVPGRVEEGDKVLGFEMGADDYVTKPFSPRELVARVRAVARRGKNVEAADRKHHLKAGDLEIDRHRFEVTLKG